MILGFKKWSGLALTTLLFAYAAVAGEMPFPSIENGKVKLVVADSPYLLEQGAVFSAKDTLEIEPGVTVLMGEYAKLTLSRAGTVCISYLPTVPSKSRT